MMNKNDYHYVLRRIITFLIISALSFFLFQSCAKAESFERVDFPTHWIAVGNGTKNIVFNENGILPNKNGWLIFSMYTQPTAYVSQNNSTFGVYRVEIQANTTTTCDIGSTTTFNDNISAVQIYTVKCPVKTNANGISAIALYRYSDNGIAVEIGERGTFVTEDDIATEISNSIAASSQATVSSMNTANQQLTDIKYQNEREITAIIDSKNQAHSDSQAEQQAINNNTQAINNLNDTVNANYTYDPSMENLTYFFDNNDQDIIRTLLLLPFNILGYIITILTSNTCYDITLGSLYGTQLTMPCIWIVDYLGPNLYDLIDTIFTILISLGTVAYLFKVLRKVFTVANDTCETCGVEVFK